jgi:diguanylate cyclase (GGDEF)-like protein
MGDQSSRRRNEAVSPLNDWETVRESVAAARDRKAENADEAARIRDSRATQRDREADVADKATLDLDGDETRLGRRTLRLGTLRGRGVTGRERAAAGRRQAAHERTLASYDRYYAAKDRELGAHDRQESKRDREDAGTDELTGARRRSLGLAELGREIARARRTDEPLTVAFVDVDDLKHVHDFPDHGAGDEILRAAAAGLRAHMRSYDLLVRLGGDEFLCVLPGVGADQVRRRFHNLGSQLTASPTAGSVGVGLADLRDGDEAQDLIDRADHNMLGSRRR